MPTFSYSAFKADGSPVSGVLEADNMQIARQELKKSGLYPRELSEVRRSAEGKVKSFFSKGVALPELSLMTRRLSTLLGSSVPVYEAIATLYEQEAPGELREVLGRVRSRLAEGANLARALAEDSAVFSESYVSMVAAGEASGALDSILDKLADFLEEQEAVRSRILTSLAYPALMVVVGTAVMLFLLAFVIPKIIVIFEQNKATLPLITILLIKASTLLRKGWWLLAAAGIGIVYAYRRLIKREDLRLRRDILLLRMPLLGPLLSKLILSRFAKILGLLLASGVPVIKAMEITGEVVVNRHYRKVLQGVREELAEGGSLSTSLRSCGLFPPMLVHMVAVGEKGGTLEEMLTKAGSAFEKEFVASVTRFMSLLEPLMVLAMGVVVGTVVVAVLLPIFQLNQLVR
ncbi:MAG: type II secretion system protein GspF [Deltaproteobacteria bacterium]|nr:type II secretion system protein GspF [Deltaproteobacteria bacterium]TLN03424.1 MAG: type II secretion system protein GspF [bacterium]